MQLLPFHQLGESKYQRLNLPYAFDGIRQLKEQDVSAFADVLRSADWKCRSADSPRACF